MNGDHGALCFTKHGQEILRVLLHSLGDPLEKAKAAEEGCRGPFESRAAGSVQERSEAEGRSQARGHCGYSVKL